MKTIAIINIGPIGDVIATSHICLKLKEKYPESEIIYITQTISVEAAKCLPHISKVYNFKRYCKNAALEMFKLAFEIRKNHKISLALSLTDNFRSSIIAFLICSKMRIGRNYEGNGIFLTHTIPSLKEERDGQVHIKEHYNRIMQPLGLDEIESKSTFIFSQEDKDKVTGLLKSNNWNGEELIGFCPCTGKIIKDWDPMQAVDFLKEIQNKNNKIVIVGTERAYEFILKMKEVGFDNYIDLTNKTTIPELGALISLFSKFISTDSAPMHIAFNLNIPTLALFIQPNYTKWGPNDFSRHSLAFDWGKLHADKVWEKYQELCDKNSNSV